MSTKLEEQIEIKQIIEFLQLAEKLKCTLRHGWTSTGRQESVADHCWRLALMVMLCNPYLDQKINIERALKMALVHDIAESITGDIPYFEAPEGSKAKEKKKKEERKAMTKIRELLPSNLKEEIYGLWEEYEAGETYEAKVVKALDKLEAQLQINASDKKWILEAQIGHCLSSILGDKCEFDSFLNSIAIKLTSSFSNKINS